MKGSTKVELFEQMRREYELRAGTIAGVAKKFGVHWRMAPDALASAIPADRTQPERRSPKLDPVKEFIDAILTDDRKAPRKHFFCRRPGPRRQYPRTRIRREIPLRS